MNVISWLRGWRSTRFVKRRFVIVGIPSSGIEELEGLNPIEQPESPVVAATPRPMIPLPLRARSLIISGTLLPMSSCIETSARLKEVVVTGGKGWWPGLVHHKYITRTWTKYQAKTHLVHLKSIQNFPNQFSCSVPGSGNGQYIHSVLDHVTRVSPSGTPWEHSKFSQRKYPEFS